MRTKGLPDLLAKRLFEESMSPNVPVSVAELHKRLLPYHVCRSELGLATKAEYDLAMLELLRDERYTKVDEVALRKAVSEELASPEPGLAFLQRFAASEIRLRAPRAPDPSEGPDVGAIEAAEADLERVTLAPPGSAGNDEAAEGRETGPPVVKHELAVDPGSLVPGLHDPLFVPQGEAAPAGGATREGGIGLCHACGTGLPARDGLRYCPRCGADQWSWACEKCGATVERGWRYCAMCGKLQPAYDR